MPFNLHRNIVKLIILENFIDAYEYEFYSILYISRITIIFLALFNRF
jgi:hypothetical protein